jgi:hypothetical protein
MNSIGREPVTLFGRRGQAAAESARDFLERNQVPLRWVDLDLDPLAAFLSDRELETATQPMALFADGSRTTVFPAAVGLAATGALHSAWLSRQLDPAPTEQSERRAGIE